MFQLVVTPQGIELRLEPHSEAFKLGGCFVIVLNNQNKPRFKNIGSNFHQELPVGYRMNLKWPKCSESELCHLTDETSPLPTNPI